MAKDIENGVFDSEKINLKELFTEEMSEDYVKIGEEDWTLLMTSDVLCFVPGVSPLQVYVSQWSCISIFDEKGFHKYNRYYQDLN